MRHVEATAKQARKRECLDDVIETLTRLWDERALLPEEDASKARDRNTALIQDAEARLVSLARPKHWRLRDLKTAGIRELSAAGIQLQQGTISYAGSSWPAPWSVATLSGADDRGVRRVSIRRVVARSVVPLRKNMDGNPWVIEIGPDDRESAVTLVACINVASRMRLATFPTGTYF